MNSPGAFSHSPVLTDWAGKQVEQALRSLVTAAERMSGSPQDCAVAAPPESKADIEPTIANTSSQPLA